MEEERSKFKKDIKSGRMSEWTTNYIVLHASSTTQTHKHKLFLIFFSIAQRPTSEVLYSNRNVSLYGCHVVQTMTNKK